VSFLFIISLLLDRLVPRYRDRMKRRWAFVGFLQLLFPAQLGSNFPCLRAFAVSYIRLLRAIVLRYSLVLCSFVGVFFRLLRFVLVQDSFRNRSSCDCDDVTGA